MKKNFLLQLICGLLLITTGQASAQEQKATWGSDIIVSPAAGRYYKNARVSVGYDGTIYVGRLWATSPSGPYQNWEVIKSADTGHTFSPVVSANVSGSNLYRSFDMITAGANATDFKVFVARCSTDTTTGHRELYYYSYDAAGTHLNTLAYEVDTYANGYNRAWESLSLASDWKEPNSISSPYNISLAGVKGSSYDSIVVWVSKDAGTTVTRRSLYGTIKYIKNISAAVGSTIPAVSTYGRLGVVWDEYGTYLKQWGNVNARYVFADDASDPSININVMQVGLNDSMYRNPSITLSQQTGTVTGPGDSDIRTVILMETNNITGNYTSIVGRTDDSLILHNINLTQGTTVAFGTAAGGILDPHSVYDPAYNNFMVTYYDSAAQALVYSLKALSSTPTSAVNVFKANYRDASTAMGMTAYPRTDINNVIHQAVFVWNDNYKTMLDAEYALPTSVQSILANVTDVQVFPNPATDQVNVAFVSQQPDNVTARVYDITGRQISSMQASVDAGINKIAMSVSTLPTGNYFVNIKGDKVDFNLRFAKE